MAVPKPVFYEIRKVLSIMCRFLVQNLTDFDDAWKVRIQTQ